MQHSFRETKAGALSRVAASGLAAAFLFICGSAVSATPETALFVNSWPLGASVLIDGVLQEAPTPMLVRGLTSGPHEVVVSLKGIGRERTTVMLRLGSHSTVTAELGGSGLTMRPGPETGVQSGDPRHVSPGTYRVSERGLEPSFPSESALRVLNIAAPLLTGLVAVSLAVDSYGRNGEERVPSAHTVTLATVAGSAVVANVAVRLERRRFLGAATEPVSLPNEGRATELYQESQDALSDGDLFRALESLSALLTETPDSRLVAESLYLMGRILVAVEDHRQAAWTWELALTHYPTPEVYDRTALALARLYVGREEYERAARLIELIVFADPAVRPEDVHALEEEIRSREIGS